MKILLFGSSGQVGWELQHSLAPLGQLKACNRNAVDLMNPDVLRAVIRDYCPNVIVNAAAYTAVDKAESEPDRAECINSKAVELLANETKRLNAWLLHYSTDYIFDGTKSGLYVETDKPNPLGVYGRTKLQGEQAIRQSGCRSLVFRTSWVYAARGSNFVRTIVRLAVERDTLDVVSDQVGAPTSAELIAGVTALCLYRVTRDKAFGEQAGGAYHLTSAGETSWYGLAGYLLDGMQGLGIELCLRSENVHPVTTAEYRSTAKRPLNSRLDTRKLTDTFGIYPPPWQFHMQKLISELARMRAS